MIRNDREYRITKAQVADFENSLATVQANTEAGVHRKIRKAQVDSINSQLNELRADVADYDALRTGRRNVIDLASLEELPRALIEGRIAAGLTQRDLGERLGMPEQQVQRYEASNYSAVSFSRLVEIAGAIGIKVREEVFMPQVQVDERHLTRRLAGAGVDRGFVARMLLNHEDDEEDDPARALRAAGAVQRIFGWAPADIFASKAPLPPARGVNTAMFKVFASAAETRTRFLAAFGMYIAQVVLRATPHLKAKPIPRDARAFRELLFNQPGQVDMATTLAVLWDLGVPVVPLAEAGGYHGACWRFDGRNVVVLKQQTSSEARWLHDVLHETHHASSAVEEREFVWLDDETMPLERRNAPEEKWATRFAGDVQLDGRAEELALKCVESAGKKTERLKAVVPAIAQANGVSAGALANYLAWRLEMDGINWWGTAANLQEPGADPAQTVRDFLIPRLDWSQLDRLDRELLTRALQQRANDDQSR